MKLRHKIVGILWLLSLPLILEGTSGCDEVFSLDRVALSDNALRCSCACAGGGSRAASIVASAQDAEETADDPVELTGPDLDLGERIVGLRFETAAIPPGAQIVSAYIQFAPAGTSNTNTTVNIAAELSSAAAPFTTNVHDLSDRLSAIGGAIEWDIPAWAAGAPGALQQTPDLAAIIQELVVQSAWTSTSPVVFLITGVGARPATAFDGNAARAPVLHVTYDSTVAATIPVCATAPAHAADKSITPESLAVECNLVEQTFEGLAAKCGYPSECECDVFDVPDQDDSFLGDVCFGECVPEPVDDTCSNFDPNQFAECLSTSVSVDTCKPHVSATNEGDDTPICVASGSPLAFHMYGERSLCEVAGTSEIHVGDREPQRDPETAGFVEVVGGGCPGVGCRVLPWVDLTMDPITFSVKWASDPTFYGLSASGLGLETAVVDGLEASFEADTFAGTGNGRRGAEGLALMGNNANPLRIGLDWSASLCDLNGNLAGTVDGEVPDGTCEGDGTTACTADAPDCDEAGGPCVLEAEDVENMSVEVKLTGALMNQPPAAAAGPDMTVECTSSAGAEFLLDGRGSSDPDANLALAAWRSGSRVGPVISDDLIARPTLAIDESGTFVLRVIDAYAQTDEDEATAEVVDTTVPEIACNNPATAPPPSPVITFSATASDVCDDDVDAEITGVECYQFTAKGKRKDVPCRVAVNGGTISIRNTGGLATHIDWDVEGTDDSGKTGTATCHILIVNPSS